VNHESAAAEPKAERYRPLNRRRRLLLALLAIAVAITGVLTLLDPLGGVQRKRRLPQPCSAGQQEGCVGGKSEVLIVGPAASAASLAR
jgi:hypothetical protein